MTNAYFLQVQEDQWELDAWINLFAYLNDSNSDVDKWEIVRLLQTAPTPGKQVLFKRDQDLDGDESDR